MPPDIEYVQVASFSGASNNNAAITFAEAIQDQIRTADKEELVGWIVDLRGNYGR